MKRKPGAAFPVAYRAWIGAGRKRPALWRVFLGMILIAALWVLSSALLLLPRLVSPRAPLDGSLKSQIFGDIEPIFAGLLVLATFSGIWIGVLLAVRLLHKRSVASVMSARGLWRWKDVLTGVVLAIGFFTLLQIIAILCGERTPFDLASILAWGPWLVPLLLLVFLQSGAEELMLRGYLQQQLAARCRNPLIWFILPSLLFGLLHWQPGWQGWAYVTVTTFFGLTAAAIVWRTGSLAGAMGLHFGNNALHFCLLTPVEMIDSLFREEWLAEVGTPTAFMLDGAFFLIVFLLVISPWTPFKAPSLRDRMRTSYALR